MAPKFMIIFASCCVLAYVLAQAPQEEAQEQKHQARGSFVYDDEEDFLESFPVGANWTQCDISVDPLLSCYDCSTRMICKPVGGLLKACRKPWRSYCNGGLCSAIPSPQCA